MSYHHNTTGRHAEISQLASAIAGQLPDYEHSQDSAGYISSAILRHKTRPVWFEIRTCWKDAQRILVTSTRPPRWPHGTFFNVPHPHSITCSKHRPPEALAADIARRFLADYAPEFIKNYQAAHRAEQHKKQEDFEREQLRQAFGGEWEHNPHDQWSRDKWNEQTTGLSIRWNYNNRPTFSIETPAGEPAKLLAMALRYALQTINQQTEKDSAA